MYYTDIISSSLTMARGYYVKMKGVVLMIYYYYPYNSVYYSINYLEDTAITKYRKMHFLYVLIVAILVDLAYTADPLLSQS